MSAMGPGRAALAAIGQDARRAGGLALACTLFVDCAILAVPLFDAHVLDDVLADRSLETLAALGGLCAVALLLHAVMDWVRSGAFLVLADRLAHHADGPLLEACLARDLGAGLAAAGGPVRDLNEVRLFVASGPAALPLDLLAAPFLAALLFALHPALGWLGLGGAALLLLLAVLSDGTARADLAAGHVAASAANAGLAARLREPDAVATLGLLDGICALWAAEHGRARRRTARATARARRVEAGSRLARLLLQGLLMAAAVAAATRGEATPGVTLAAAVLFARLVLPVDQCVAGWRQWIVALAAWRRVRAALLALPAPRPAVSAAVAAAGLLVEDVAWTAPGGRAVLCGVSFAVAPGEAVALAGANGAGKSTLARVAAGVLAPGAGRVLLDGRDLHRDPDRAALAARVGLLPQAVLLLEGSVHDTIARFGTGPGAEASAVVATARRAGAHELVGRLPRGYAAAVSPLGPELSGGQRQRLALARALHGSPRLLVLDEPDAHLDAEGEAALIGALRAARAEGSAVLMVSHRPALLAEADRVLTVADGALADPAATGPAARVLA